MTSVIDFVFQWSVSTGVSFRGWCLFWWVLSLWVLIAAVSLLVFVFGWSTYIRHL